MTFRIMSKWFPHIYVQGKFDKEGYYEWVISGGSIVLGMFLILEHWVTWGGFDIVWGHEWLGFVFVIFGMGIGIRKKVNKNG